MTDGMVEYANQLAQKHTLLADVVNFLNYVDTDKGLRLTQTSKNLMLKDVRAINSLFVEPEELDEQIGDHLFRLRTEQEARRVHFIRCLCQAAGPVKIRKGWISQTKRATEFLKEPPFQQLCYLFIAWWWNDDWGRFIRQPELANLCRENTEYFVNVFETMKPNSVIEFADFARTASNRIGYIVDSEYKRDQAYTNLIIEFVLIRPLELFGALRVDYEEREHIQEAKSFSLTSLGKLMFDQLLFLEEDLEDGSSLSETDDEDYPGLEEETDSYEHLVTESPHLRLLEGGQSAEMSVKKAISDYLAELKKTASQKKFTRHEDCLELFLDYLASYTDCNNLKDLDPGHFREFLSHWYIKKVGMSASHAVDTLRATKQFAKWLDQNKGGSLCAELKEDFQRLSKDFPAVFKVRDALWECDTAQGLLTDPIFEQFLKMGGEKAKEILKVGDIEPFNPDNVDYDQLQEGYFRITDIRDDSVEVAPHEGGGSIFPVKFPKKALRWLKTGFVINLSLAPNKKTSDWEILEHGFVYPQ